MGMTIDEAINGVEKRILPIFDNDEDHEALVTAIETMRKYQKIEQILHNGFGKEIYAVFDEIVKAVEDGTK